MTSKNPLVRKEPDVADANPPSDDQDTEGHSLLNAQFGGVMANDRARDAAKWAKAEHARKQQAEHDRAKGGRR